MLLQDFRGIFEIGGLMGSNKIFLRHHIPDLLLHRLLEAEITVGDYTHQTIVAIHHRNSSYLELRHHGQCVCHFFIRRNTDRIQNHTILRTFYCPYLLGLLCNTHILMDHTNASFPGDGNSHRGLGNRIHGSRHHGNIKRYISGKLRREIYILGEYLRISGD